MPRDLGEGRIGRLGLALFQHSFELHVELVGVLDVALVKLDVVLEESVGDAGEALHPWKRFRLVAFHGGEAVHWPPPSLSCPAANAAARRDPGRWASPEGRGPRRSKARSPARSRSPRRRALRRAALSPSARGRRRGPSRSPRA